MKPTEGREAAYVVSHVKDNSRITNILDYAGLFACVTPWGPRAKDDSDTLVYAPVLIQDTDTLDRVFGDPRIDPEKYRDLYAVREIVKAGFSVYIAKVPSGDPASFALLLGDASDHSTVTEEMRTDKSGVLDIPGICDIPELTGGIGIPALGFGMPFKVTDTAAKYMLDPKDPNNNVVEMKEKGEFGNSLFVKLSRETITEERVEVGKIYTVHIGKDTVGQVKEIDYLASSGDSIENAFAGNAVVSGKFDKSKSEEDLLKAFNEWKHMEGGRGVYHGAWKISTISDLRTVYGVEKDTPEKDSPLYKIVTFWLVTAKAGDFILTPFNAPDPDADPDADPDVDPNKDLARLIPTLTSYGASEGSVIAIDTPDVDWYTGIIKDTVEDNKYTVLMHGSDAIATSVPQGTFGTYPSSAKIVGTEDPFGMNIAVAMAIYSTANALTKEERSADMLGRFLPDMVPYTSTGGDVPFKKDVFEEAKRRKKITFEALESGDIRLCIANSPVPCTCLVEGVDYTVSTEVKEGKAYTRIMVPMKLDSEGNTIPYEDGFPVTVKHTKSTDPYAEAVSSITDKLYLKTDLVQLKPKSLKLYAMDVKLYESYDKAAPDKGIIKEARFSLPENLTNGSFISSLNSVLGSYLTFTLMEPYKEEGFDIVKSLRDLVKEGKNCSQPVVLSEGRFNVSVNNYQTALNEFIDPRYSGCFISELSAMVTKEDGKIDHLKENADESERRALHYLIKMIAADRKDLTCVFTTPHGLSLDQACNWVNSLGEYSDLWEYGSEGATSYADQSFYCEMYWDWINVTCQKLNNGVPSKTVVVPMSPAYQVIMKGLASYRVRGTFYPVAGEQGGVLGDEVRVTRNPSQKFERDKLINYHINPIYDLGVQGIQIYGNETLNPVYSDLSAAHIARTLIYIRSRVDRYTNTQVFSLNDLSLWQRWKQYVSSMILAPLASLGGLAAYNVKMGFDTTKAELIAQRKINGVIELQFVPDAEIYTVEFVVNSSANTVESSIT